MWKGILLVLIIGTLLIAGCAQPDNGGDGVTPPAGKGIFKLLISDAPADIADFNYLYVTFSSARVFPKDGNNSGGFIQLQFDTKIVDLTKVVDGNAVSVLEVELDEGKYSKIELFIEKTDGMTNNGEANVKIPSGKLMINKEFDISEAAETRFVFDIEVVKTGQGMDYNLRPVIAKSGVVGKDIEEDDIEEIENEEKGKDKDDDKDKGKDDDDKDGTDDDDDADDDDLDDDDDDLNVVDEPGIVSGEGRIVAALTDDPIVNIIFFDGDQNTGDLNTGNGDVNNSDLNTGNGDLNIGNGDLNTGNGDLNTGNGDLNTGNGDQNVIDNNVVDADGKIDLTNLEELNITIDRISVHFARAFKTDEIDDDDDLNVIDDDDADDDDLNTGNGDDLNTGNGDLNTGNGDLNTGNGGDLNTGNGDQNNGDGNVLLMAGAGKWIVLSSEVQSYDLLELETTEALIADKNISAGKYTQIRLSIKSATAVVDGITYAVEVPPQKLILHGPFDLEPDSTTYISLDFDVGKSLHATGNGRLILKPTIKLSVVEDVESVEIDDEGLVEIEGGDETVDEELEFE